MRIKKQGPVIHLLGSLTRGGAETVTLDLIRAIQVTGAENVVVCLSGRTGPLEPEYRATSAKIILIDFFSRPVHGIVKLTVLAFRSRASAVVSNVSLPSAFFLIPFLFARVPVRVARFHSDSDGRDLTPMVRVRRRLLVSVLRVVANRILAVSPDALKFAGGRGSVLPNGVDTTSYKYAERNKERDFRVVNVGRPDPAKNRVRLRGISGELIRLGYQPINVVGQAGEDIGPADEPLIKFLGPRSPIATEYLEADCLLIVSVREGLPGVLLEALASGVPVVASDLPGIRAVSEHLPGVTLIDLHETDAFWAEKVVEACALRRTDFSRAISEAVARSDYALGSINTRWLIELGIS